MPRKIASVITLIVLILVSTQVFAQDDTEVSGTTSETLNETTNTTSPFHPLFALLDSNGDNVLDSGLAVSTMQTCGACHDTTFIESHSFHADVGLSEFGNSDALTPHEWDNSPGYFGRWDPLTYRYLSNEDDTRIDMTTAEWIQVFGARHVGGGPATTNRDGVSILDQSNNTITLENSVVDPTTGDLLPWDWDVSGVVEMNCFLCHTPNPDNVARVASLEAGEFQWANTATLNNTAIVSSSANGWLWNTDAFTDAGEVRGEIIAIQDPDSNACGNCHGAVHLDAQVPLVIEPCSTDDWRTYTTGQVISPQKISNSGLNLVDKNDYDYAWDIHAERVLNCVDCHYSLNNPVYFTSNATSRPEHLTFDPRRMDFADYLWRPLHEFAKGQSAQSSLAPQLDNSLRRCESCHDYTVSHDWLPYQERHAATLACESCHIPQISAPALQSMDWTVLREDGSPITACRGQEVVGDANDVNSNILIRGYEPILLPRINTDGTSTLAPHNLITVWYWVYGDPAQPVPMRDLEAVWHNSNNASEINALFDENNDGILSDIELHLNTDAKVALIQSKLTELGLSAVRIAGEVQPYSINHNVAHGEWATSDCQTCHAEESRIVLPLELSNRTPGGIIPTLNQSTIAWNGDIEITENGTLIFQPRTQSEAQSLYIFGHDSVALIDLLGTLMFLGVWLGVIVHGGLRYLATRRRSAQPANHHNTELQEAYMYGVYERFWHWLQTLAIFLLIFTGLVIHRPEQFSMFSFAFVVEVHNILAVILVINASLSAFYHLVSGEIRQFLPQPHGFFDQMFTQAKFYLNGIFRNDPHPFERTPQRKLNPLQQVTYLMILNVLLPAQIITGILMWGVQRWDGIANFLGGLPVLAPVHTLIAWMFASFIVLHVYLTTTGHTPLAGIKAMMMGWDDLEVNTNNTQNTNRETQTEGGNIS